MMNQKADVPPQRHRVSSFPQVKIEKIVAKTFDQLRKQAEAAKTNKQRHKAVIEMMRIACEDSHWVIITGLLISMQAVRHARAA